MAKETLTALAVHKARGNVDMSDGGGIFIKVRDDKARGAYRYTSPTTSARREMGLKVLDRSSLAATGKSLMAVRAAVARARLQIANGVDPIDNKRAERAKAEADRVAKKTAKKVEALTLCRYARQYYETAIEPSERYTPLHKLHWISSLENHLGSGKTEIWSQPIATITPPELLRALASVRSLDDKKKWIPETLSRIRQRLETIFEDAMFHGAHPGANPATAIKKKLSKLMPERESEGFRFLPYPELPDFMLRLRDVQGIAARALEFCILCGSRTSEVLGARWSEIDLKSSTWVIPRDRMKARRQHIVHLSAAARAVLAGVRELDPVFCFPTPMPHGDEGEPLSNMALLDTLDRLEIRDRATVHGFRKSFSTWGNEVFRARKDVVERALAHTDPDKTRETYNKAELLEERAQLLDAWAGFCMGVPAGHNVVPIGKGAA